MTKTAYEHQLAQLKRQLDAERRQFAHQQAQMRERLAEQEALLDLYRLSEPARLDILYRV